MFFFFSFRNFSPSHINFTPLQKIFLLRNNRSNEGSEGGGERNWIDRIIRDIDMVNIRDTAMEGRAAARKEG